MSSFQGKTVGEAILMLQEKVHTHLMEANEAMKSQEEIFYLEALSKAIIAQKSSEFITDNIFDFEDDFTTSGALLELEVHELSLYVQYGAKALAKARFISQLDKILTPMGWQSYLWE